MKVFGMVHKLNAQTQLLGFMSFKYALKSLPVRKQQRLNTAASQLGMQIMD